MKTFYKTVHVVSKWFVLLAHLFGTNKRMIKDSDNNEVIVKTLFGKNVIVKYVLKYKKVK